MGDHFYLTLPSDAYVNYYPGNTASHFVAKSPERIHLESNYEVGLSEFIYPHTWNNVDNRKQTFWVGVLGSGELFGGIAYVKTGYYRDGNKQLFRFLNIFYSDEGVCRFSRYSHESHVPRTHKSIQDSKRNFAAL
jgi:hypothetical protein